MEEVVVHPLTNTPTEAWEQMKNERTRGAIMRFKTKNPKEPAPPNKARVVCLSDTHSMTSHIRKSLPDGDILIHAGDFTRCGHVAEVKEFNEWLAAQPHKHKIVIAGNHELSFDPSFQCKQEGLNPMSPSPRGTKGRDPIAMYYRPSMKILDIPTLGLDREVLLKAIETASPESIQSELKNCIYLEDKSVTIYGIKIYGTPWQPEFCNWAFNLPRGKACLEKWDLIPDDTDILVTHSPPVGFGDLCCSGVRAGDVELLNSVQKRIKPKYHIYGHIHEGYGIRSDGRTVFINASICNMNYMPSNKPVVFDIPIPEGFSKD